MLWVTQWQPISQQRSYKNNISIGTLVSVVSCLLKQWKTIYSLKRFPLLASAACYNKAHGMLQRSPYQLPLPLYRLAGAWQVCPQPLAQHFLGEGQCWSDEQLSTQAAANPVARWGGGQSPWRDNLREVRKSLLVTHSVCFWEKEQGGGSIIITVDTQRK